MKKRKRILHIFPDSLFLDGYISMLSKDKKNEHLIILTDIGSGKNTDINSNEMIIGKVSTFKLFDFIKLRRYLKNEKYDRLILHSCYLNFLLLAFPFNKKVLKKSVLTLWGGQDSQAFKVPKKKIIFFPLAYIYEKMRKVIYKNVIAITSFMDADYNSVKLIYQLKCPYFHTSYPVVSNKFSDILRKKSCDSVNIQVCHSGSIHANTLELLDKLSIYSNENIKIYAIISYDDSDNCVQIEKKGFELFGDKFIPIKDYMLPLDYAKYISELDIMIFNSMIQQGLGNIYLGFSSGVKIVLRKDGLLEKNLGKEGYIFNTIDELIDDKNVLLKSLSDEDKKFNFLKAKSVFDTKEILDNWSIVFDYK